MSKDLLVIDGHHFLWRAFSVPFKFSSPKGTPLHVVSTYLKLIRRTYKVMDDLGAKGSLVVVFDTDTSNGNFELLSDYKGNRRAFTPDEDSPYCHLPLVKKALATLGIPFLEIPFVEADDVIATIVTQFNDLNKKNRSLIFSSDTDFYQLLGEQTRIIKLKPKDEYELINTEYIKNKLGINPRDYVFFKSLAGDSADNIKGVFGIGNVSARKIISGEMIFDKTKYQDILELNAKLISLDCHLNFPCDLGSLLLAQNLNLPNKEIFQLCEF